MLALALSARRTTEVTSTRAAPIISALSTKTGAARLARLPWRTSV